MPMEVSGIRDLVRRLGRADAELTAELRPAVLHAASLVGRKAEANAGFSSAIPGLEFERASFSSTSGGAVVGFHERGFPHAGEVRVYEGDGVSPEPFRHPVFGGPGWAAGMTHPFLGPAAEDERAAVLAEIRAAVLKVLT